MKDRQKRAGIPKHRMIKKEITQKGQLHQFLSDMEERDRRILTRKKRKLGEIIEVDIDETLFEKSIDYIEREIKMEIARMIWGQEERYKVWHVSDTDLIGALSYFNEAEELLRERLALGNL